MLQPKLETVTWYMKKLSSRTGIKATITWNQLMESYQWTQTVISGNTVTIDHTTKKASATRLKMLTSIKMRSEEGQSTVLTGLEIPLLAFFFFNCRRVLTERHRESERRNSPTQWGVVMPFPPFLYPAGIWNMRAPALNKLASLLGQNSNCSPPHGLWLP